MTTQEVKKELEDLAKKVKDLDSLVAELSPEANQILNSGPCTLVLQAVTTVKSTEIFARYFDVDLEKMAKFRSNQS